MILSRFTYLVFIGGLLVTAAPDAQPPQHDVSVTPPSAPTLTDLAEVHRADSRQADRGMMSMLLAGSPPYRGPANAPVTMVEFVDFQCPSCRSSAEALTQLPGSEAKRLRLVFRHHPFSFHAWARKAAATSICVDVQDHGAFWEFADFLFAHQDDLTGGNFDARVLPFLSDELHLNPAAIKSCLDQGEYKKALSEDEQLAVQYDVRKTPTFFVNGQRFVGYRGAEELKSAIDAALAATHTQPPASPGRTTP